MFSNSHIKPPTNLFLGKIGWSEFQNLIHFDQLDKLLPGAHKPASQPVAASAQHPKASSATSQDPEKGFCKHKSLANNYFVPIPTVFIQHVMWRCEDEKILSLSMCTFPILFPFSAAQWKSGRVLFTDGPIPAWYVLLSLMLQQISFTLKSF